MDSNNKETVLITGGSGYVGSHTVIALTEAGYDVIIVDHFINSRPSSVERLEKFLGKSIPMYNVDLAHKEGIEEIFKNHKIDHVIHMASLKAVGVSCTIPLEYYRNNLFSTVNLLEVMQAHQVYSFVMSSSATVYGDPQFIPMTEKHPRGACTNPYGRTKYIIEQILTDICAVPDNKWRVTIMRYFNPGGAHPTGEIGEDPQGVPHNLLPYLTQVAIGKLPHARVYGNDYDTVDGTGVRDYVHVMDLAEAHEVILKANGEVGLRAYNIGTKQGYSVLQIIKCLEEVSGKKIPYKVEPRRDGDVPTMVCDSSLIKEKLGWSTKRNLKDMCRDMWAFQSKNPNGYQ